MLLTFIMRAIPNLLALCLPVVLAACASPGGDYPSLAIRDVERITDRTEATDPDEALPPLAAPSAELKARLAQLVQQARGAHGDFTSRQNEVRRAVARARGAAIASEIWTEAQVALSSLEAARSQAMVALGELDQLYATERIENWEQETLAAQAIADARDRVDSWVREENEVLSGLIGSTPG